MAMILMCCVICLLTCLFVCETICGITIFFCFKFVFVFFFGFQSNLEYERYLKEVVNALESDQEFRAKLDNASEVDVRVSRRREKPVHVD